MYLVVGGLFVLLAIYHFRRFLLVPKEIEQLPPSNQFRAASGPPRGVSFLVAGWNAVNELEPFIAGFRSLPVSDKQLILCVGGSDGTYDKARMLAGGDVIVLEQSPGMGKQKALQKGLPFASGDWIYLTDIDSRLPVECVNTMFAALATGRSECVTGGMGPLSSQEHVGFVRAQWALDRYGNLKTPSFTSGILGANTLLTRNALHDAGDFGQEARSGTDYTLAKELIAAGHQILHVKDAEVRTEFSEKLGSYAKRRARWLRNVLVLGKKYGCRGEVRAVLITIGLSFLYPVLLVVGVAVWWVWGLLVLLVLHSFLNRIRYCRVAGVECGLINIGKTILGDAFAGMRAGYEASIGSVRW